MTLRLKSKPGQFCRAASLWAWRTVLWASLAIGAATQAQQPSETKQGTDAKQPAQGLNETLLEWAIRTGQVTPRNPKRPWPKQLDAEQKAMLTESPNLFPFKEPAERFGIYRIDERYFLQSEMKGEGWIANSEAERRVFRYDRITGTRQETPLRGALRCYSPQRVILSTGDRYFEEGGKKKRVYTTLEGPPDGSAMQAHEYPDRHDEPSIDQRFNLETCMPYADRSKFFPEGTHGYVYALKPGHGLYVIRDRKRAVRQEPSRTHWVMNEQGQALVELPIVAHTPQSFKVHFVSKTQRYFIVQYNEEDGDTSKDSAKPRPVVSFGPLGQDIQFHPHPPLLRNFWDWQGADQHGTAIGIVYSISANDDPNNPMVGVYIEREGRVHRLLNKPARATVSPDGCRLSVTYFDRPTPVRFRPRDASDYASRMYQLCTEK
jgi:hypothetical protein